MALPGYVRPSSDATFFHVDNPLGIDVRLFANSRVPFEEDAFHQLFDFLDVVRAIDEVRAHDHTSGLPFFGDAAAGVDRVVLTPDFHKGALVPVGTVVRARSFVVPKAIGNDVCCGMRLLVTDLPAEAIFPHLPAIEARLRAIFFGGERDIPMSPRQREALLRGGLPALLDVGEDNASRGIWRRIDLAAARDDVARVHHEGHFPTRRLFGFEGLVRSSGAVDGRDPQIGCVGGGNHFVELQRVDALLDGHASRAWGLTKGALAIMVHSGSVGLGHAVGGHFMERAREVFPQAVRSPRGGFFPLPTHGPRAEEGLFYLDGMGNAANFAFANRLFLGEMALRAIAEATGRSVSGRLVYDAPHNVVFREGDVMLHRKGATPAEGPEAPDWIGRPVIIPGSMGAASYLLAGAGNGAALESACHGAGRAISRGRAAHATARSFGDALGKLRVVGPIDPRSPMLARRRDVLAKYEKRLMEEAPYAYKDVEPVVDSVEDANVARKVARLWPLVTVKG